MRILKAFGSGLIGAGALTVFHEAARRMSRKAPRADVLGRRALARLLRAVGKQPPSRRRLERWALAGDLASNALYYSLVGAGGGRYAWLLGSVLGAAAGVGATTLPGPLGLGRKPTARTPATAAMTIAWYLAGGLATAAAYKLLASRSG